MSARAWLLFAAVSLIWGIPYLLIKVAIEGGMPPVSIASLRVALGAVALLLARPARRRPRLAARPLALAGDLRAWSRSRSRSR